VRGQNSFGFCLERGSGIEKDLIRYAEYHRLSAEQGHSSGQYNFGRCLENGIGVEDYLNRCAQSYQLSTEQGNIDYFTHNS
jgi:TPR repeat protein